MLDISELASVVIRSELMWFHDSIFSEYAFSTTVQMENLGTNVTTVTAVSPTIFYRNGSKKGLKCSVCASINLELK